MPYLSLWAKFRIPGLFLSVFKEKVLNRLYGSKNTEITEEENGDTFENTDTPEEKSQNKQYSVELPPVGYQAPPGYYDFEKATETSESQTTSSTDSEINEITTKRKRRRKKKAQTSIDGQGTAANVKTDDSTEKVVLSKNKKRKQKKKRQKERQKAEECKNMGFVYKPSEKE